ncbi:MAG: hypothetical protein JO004_04500, partial [Methylobacteriaceae bacterium]|nr:hypothetical protein [Methylobacteriaceae bacterium]
MSVTKPILRPKIIALILTAIIGIALSVKLVVFAASVGTTGKERNSSKQSAPPEDQQFVDLSEQQANAVKTGRTETRDFAVFRTAVGTIDFNENMLVQVFSQYPGKIIKASF